MGTAIAHPKTTQMNVRIGAELKSAGDALFAQWGLSPSEAVRRLYEWVVGTGKRPEALLAPGLSQDVASAELDQLAYGGCGLATRMYEQMLAVSLPPDSYPLMSEDELRDAMYDERLEEADLAGRAQRQGSVQ